MGLEIKFAYWTHNRIGVVVLIAKYGNLILSCYNSFLVLGSFIMKYGVYWVGLALALGIVFGIGGKANDFDQLSAQELKSVWGGCPALTEVGTGCPNDSTCRQSKIYNSNPPGGTSNFKTEATDCAINPSLCGQYDKLVPCAGS